MAEEKNAAPAQIFLDWRRFLQTEFAFFDFKEPLVLFFLDNLAIMGLFVWIGYYLGKAMRCMEKRK